MAFYLKLGVTIPLIYAITFCNLQYSRERRLEGEYAFKSNISISLVPYKDLVEKMIDSSKVDEKQKFTSFLIESISKVYSSPTEKIFDHDGRKQDDHNDLAKQLKKTIEAVVSPLEPLLKIIK